MYYYTLVHKDNEGKSIKYKRILENKRTEKIDSYIKYYDTDFKVKERKVKTYLIKKYMSD